MLPTTRRLLEAARRFENECLSVSVQSQSTEVGGGVLGIVSKPSAEEEAEEEAEAEAAAVS
jgi:hypothetical protein